MREEPGASTGTFSEGTVPIPVALPLRSLFTALLVAVALAAPTLANEWNQFRGPNGQGVADADSRLPTLFDPTVNVVWKTPLPAGHSSPVLAKDRIFLTAADGSDLWTLALDRHSGREIWRRKAPRPRSEKVDTRSHPAAASPVTDGSSVFVFFGDYGLIGYDHRGEELWRLPLGPFNNIYGMGASPILLDRQVILPVDQQTDSYLLSVDATTGKELWRVPRPEATSGHSTPVVYTPAGGEPQILLPGSFFLMAYSKDGEKLWWVRGLSFEMKSTPAMADGLLFINGYGSQFNEMGQGLDIVPFAEVLEAKDADKSGTINKEEMPAEIASMWFEFTDLDLNGSLSEPEWTYFRAAMETRNSMMAIRLPEADERGDLTETHVAWRYFKKVPQLPSPILYQGVLYMIDDRGIVTTFEPKSGQVIQQSRIEGAIDSFYSSPVAGDNKIFFAGRSGKVAVLPSGGKIQPLAVNDLDDLIYATPVVADDRLYVRTRGGLFAFGFGALSNTQTGS